MESSFEYATEKLQESTICTCRHGRFYTRGIFLDSQRDMIMGWRLASEVLLLQMERFGSLLKMRLEMQFDKTKRMVGKTDPPLVDLGYGVREIGGRKHLSRRFAMPFEDRPPNVYAISSLMDEVHVEIEPSTGLW